MSSISPIEATGALPPRRSSRLRSFFARFAFVVALLVTLVVGWYLVERVRGRVLWESYEKEARAAGVKLTIQEYLPPAVPDAENFAATPIFQEVFRAQAEGREAPNPLAWPKTGGTKPPPLADLRERRTLDLAALQRYFVETKLLAAEESNPGQGVLDALRSYDPVLEELRKAAQRPHCRFPVRWEDGMSAALPHMTVILFTGRHYSVRIAAHLAVGDNDAACRDVQEALRIYRIMAGEPTLIAGLVRMTIPIAIESAVWDGFARRQWREADLPFLDREFAALSILGDYVFSMNSERAFGNEMYAQLRVMNARKIGELTSIVQSMDQRSQGVPWQTRLFLLYPQGWFYRSQERANRYFDEVTANAAIEPPRLFLDRPVKTGPENVRGEYERTELFFFNLMVPAMQGVGTRYGSLQASTDQTRIACALERFRLAHGAFPSALGELPPDFKMPADVASGEPYRYRRTEDGGSYTLYSVATNLKDDGGDAGGKSSPGQQPDWVWFMPAK